MAGGVVDVGARWTPTQPTAAPTSRAANANVRRLAPKATLRRIPARPHTVPTESLRCARNDVNAAALSAAAVHARR